MAGSGLPLRMAIAPVLKVEDTWRPTLTVTKGPAAVSTAIIQASMWTDNQLAFTGYVPPNDSTIIKRNLTVEYDLLVSTVVPASFGVGDYSTTTGTPFYSPFVPSSCIPLPANLRMGTGQCFTAPQPSGTPPVADQRWVGASHTPSLCGYTPGLALRALPMNGNTATTTLTINGATINTPSSVLTKLLPCLTWAGLTKGALSTIPFSPCEGPIFREPVKGSTQETLISTGLNAPYASCNPENGPQPYSQCDNYFEKSGVLWQTGARAVAWSVVAGPVMTAVAVGTMATLVGSGGTAQPNTTGQAGAYTYILRASVVEDIAVGPFRIGDAWEEPGISRINTLSLSLTFAKNPVHMLCTPCQVSSLVLANTTSPPPTDYNFPYVTAGDLYALSASIVSMSLNGSTYTARQPVLRLEINTADPVTLARTPAYEVLPIETTQHYIEPNLYTPTTPYAVTLQSETIAANAAAVKLVQLKSIRTQNIPNKLIIFFTRSDTSAPPTAKVQPAQQGIFDIIDQNPIVSAATNVGTRIFSSGASVLGSSAVTNYDTNFINAKLSDHFLRIHSVSINYNDGIARCSTFSEKELWERSRRNGLRLSWEQWTGGFGSILILDMAADVGLQTAEASGQNTGATFQVLVGVSNTALAMTVGTTTDDLIYGNPTSTTTFTSSAAPWTMMSYSANQVMVFDSTCIIGQGQMTVTTESPTQAQVLRLLQANKSRMSTAEMEESPAGSGSLIKRQTITSDADVEGDDDVSAVKRSRV